MKKVEKWLIPIMIVIVIVIIAIVLLLLYRVKNQQGYNNYQDDIISSELYDYDNSEVEELQDEVSFFTVAKCISEYLDIININSDAYYGVSEEGEYKKTISDEEIAETIISLLDKDYIAENNITENNAFEYVHKVDQKEMFIPLKMNIFPGRTTEKYAVYGYTQSLDNEFIRNIYMIVTLDIENYTYSVEPLLNEEYDDINKINLKNENIPIEENDYNTYEYAKINEEYISNQYLSNFKKMLLSNPSLAYEYFDNDYKNAKFGSYAEFEKWLDTNRARIKKVNLDKYQVTVKDNYTQYVLIDKDGMYYIFRETAPMQYSAILDTYTIDIPEFTDRYEKSTNQEKIILNLNKFKLSLDDGDYRYAYRILADSFKSNNFKTEEEFENYAKSNFFEKNKFDYQRFGNEAGTYYTYEVKITDSTGKSNKEITKTFIILLGEGTDFELSFNV